MFCNTKRDLFWNPEQSWKNMKKVYILILNWNGWGDTIECLESVFRNNYKNFNVILCDNASKDNSLEKIKLWAEGSFNFFAPETNPLRSFSYPPVKKPILYNEYSFKDIKDQKINKNEEKLIIIQTGKNHGFSGGNNFGIKYALIQNDFDYIWLLNNDTVVNSNSLIELVKKMNSNVKAGICGSTLIYYYQPNRVQAFGGASFNKVFGLSKHVNNFSFNKKNINYEVILKRLDYIVGASMFVTKDFIKEIGLLNEDYFLYFDEIDWAIRSKNKFCLEYAPESIVYHKEGMSIGSNQDSKKRSNISEYYGIRNRIKFTKKYYPWYLPTVYLGFLVTIFNRIWRGQLNRLGLVFRSIIGKPPPDLFGI